MSHKNSTGNQSYVRITYCSPYINNTENKKPRTHTYAYAVVEMKGMASLHLFWATSTTARMSQI